MNLATETTRCSGGRVGIAVELPNATPKHCSLTRQAVSLPPVKQADPSQTVSLQSPDDEWVAQELFYTGANSILLEGVMTYHLTFTGLNFDFRNDSWACSESTRRIS